MRRLSTVSTFLYTFPPPVTVNFSAEIPVYISFPHNFYFCCFPCNSGHFPGFHKNLPTKLSTLSTKSTKGCPPATTEILHKYHRLPLKSQMGFSTFRFSFTRNCAILSIKHFGGSRLPLPPLLPPLRETKTGDQIE